MHFCDWLKMAHPLQLSLARVLFLHLSARFPVDCASILFLLHTLPIHELPLRYVAICIRHTTTVTPAIFVWDRLEALVLNKPIPIPPIIRAMKVGTPSYGGDAYLPRPPSTPTGGNPAYSASVVLRSCISRVFTRRARSLPIQLGERTSYFDGAHVTSPPLVSLGDSAWLSCLTCRPPMMPDDVLSLLLVSAKEDQSQRGIRRRVQIKSPSTLYFCTCLALTIPLW